MTSMLYHKLRMAKKKIIKPASESVAYKEIPFDIIDINKVMRELTGQKELCLADYHSKLCSYLDKIGTGVIKIIYVKTDVGSPHASGNIITYGIRPQCGIYVIDNAFNIYIINNDRYNYWGITGCTKGIISAQISLQLSEIEEIKELFPGDQKITLASSRQEFFYYLLHNSAADRWTTNNIMEALTALRCKYLLHKEENGILKKAYRKKELEKIKHLLLKTYILELEQRNNNSYTELLLVKKALCDAEDKIKSLSML